MAQNKQLPARPKVLQAQPQVIKIIPLTGSIGDIQTNSVSNRVYFVRNGTDVGVLDGQTNQVIGNVKAGDGATFLAINELTNRIYSTNFRDATVSVINGTTNLPITTIPVGERPFGIGIHKKSNRIYVANSNGTISILSGSDNRVLNTLQVGGSPALVGINERTNRIYVTNTGKDSVHVINGQTQKVISTIKVGKNPIISPGVNERTNRIYIANNLSRFLSVINGNINKKSIPVQLGRLQSELALNSVTNRIYVTSAQEEGPGTLYVLSGLTIRLLKTLKIPPFTFILVNPQTNHFFISDTESNKLFVYNGRTNTLITTLHTGEPAGNMALNTRTNRLYVGNESAITVVQDRK
ncbi:YncE family protein [Paenibacillus sp. SYP-B3998]|uniref:YncE family protein n=1 Tax=Paenibacillus sp. SYP-B3998 TaxID=2678564 RepID=A0A6G3ZZB3_9BACL|nr:YncE family protein [Paenibacillus sp. SYP-B3998]NEW07455.1 YncE family protein [Paenibacillus sp. SYP-B3998]